jgi:cyclophilin family peptidyl-prolyl cis-trans isomerase
MATDKRARKKQHRDEILAERAANLRRRRMERIGAVAFVGLAIVGLAIFTGRGDDEPNNQPAAPAASPTPEPTLAAAACGAEAPPAADPQQYKKPEQVLKDGVDYAAVLHTSCGDIEMDLFEDEAEQTVNSFVFLSQEGFFDGLTFHRISANFVIQGGDPEGTGRGGPGYVVPDEFPKKGNAYTFGTVAMANSGPNTTGSQFFIVTHLDPGGKPEPAGLDPLYSLFGQVDRSSYETIREIGRQEVIGGNDPSLAERPIAPVYIESIEIIER